MGRPSKNKSKMTGRKHELIPSVKGAKLMCPWLDLAVGDWFEPVAYAYAIAGIRTKIDAGREYVGVRSGGKNCVVRVK
jgi:hypothetical protein